MILKVKNSGSDEIELSLEKDPVQNQIYLYAYKNNKKCWILTISKDGIILGYDRNMYELGFPISGQHIKIIS